VFARTERAKSHLVGSPYLLYRAMKQQAWFWYGLQGFEEVKSEPLRAAKVFERLGAAGDLEDCERLLRAIDSEQNE